MKKIPQHENAKLKKKKNLKKQKKKKGLLGLGKRDITKILA